MGCSHSLAVVARLVARISSFYALDSELPFVWASTYAMEALARRGTGEAWFAGSEKWCTFTTVPLVSAHGLGKSYGARSVLQAVSLTVRTGERLGVVGQNGAGKSTLAKLMAGVEAPDRGTVTRRRGARVLYLDQVPRLTGELTAEQVVALGLGAYHQALERHRALCDALAAGSGDPHLLLDQQAHAAEEVERLGGWDQSHRITALLGHLGIHPPDLRVERLSGGEQRRVALAAVLIARPDLAVLDEPTNHLDAQTVEWLEQHLRDEFPGAVLLITHDRYLLDRVATRTIEVADRALYVYDGGYQLYLEQKAERLAHAARVEQNRQNFLRRELEWLRRQPKARSTKQAARSERAEAAMAAPKPAITRSLRLGMDLAPSGKTVLELHQLTLTMGEKTLVAGLDLTVLMGERIGVVGRNGCGKTTLLRSILGEHAPSSGWIVMGQNTRVAYFDQARSMLDDRRTVFENVVGDQTHIELGGRTVDPRAYLERFGFDGHQQRQPVGALSGGERARVALAAMLRRSASLILLDEPTNDLDVETLGALETMLLEHGMTALVVTHDRWFLDRVATAILAFESPAKVLRYPGNYASYRELLAQITEQTASDEVASASQATRPARVRPVRTKPLTFAQERELVALPDQIERLESRARELEASLSDPACYASGGPDIPRLAGELEVIKAEVEELVLRWEELETKKLG
jgi:ATP-binding cassette subfamily F protein uup